jgi:hypothetical protein
VAVVDISALPESEFIIGALRHQAYSSGTAEGGVVGGVFPSCPEHLDERLKGFCQTCDVPVCSSCVMFGHKDASHT